MEPQKDEELKITDSQKVVVASQPTSVEAEVTEAKEPKKEDKQDHAAPIEPGKLEGESVPGTKDIDGSSEVAPGKLEVDARAQIESQKNGVPVDGSSKVDGGESSSGDAVTKFVVDSSLLPFPERLMALLDGDLVKDAMWWLPEGDAFCLIPVVFAERVLDKFFQGTKFESFTRKLNRWWVHCCHF